ncbi:hypothetical protein PT2222_20082 [Paraburkholderia tropica]
MASGSFCALCAPSLAEGCAGERTVFAGNAVALLVVSVEFDAVESDAGANVAASGCCCDGCDGCARCAEGCTSASSRAAPDVSETRASSARSLHALNAQAVIAQTNVTAHARMDMRAPGKLKRLRGALHHSGRTGAKSTVIEVSNQREVQQRLEERPERSPHRR